MFQKANSPVSYNAAILAHQTYQNRVLSVKEESTMEWRLLGKSGFKVPVLCMGTATFGAGSEFFRAFGATDVADARRLVDICLDAGLTMFDSADGYSNGASEEILGQAIKGRRDQV